jgi:hydroxyacylglutathione hydrolase
MQVKAFLGGPFAAVGYLAYDRPGGKAAMIDAPVGTTKRFVKELSTQQVAPLFLINTHGHWEQTADNVGLTEATGAELLAHPWDMARLADPTLTMEDGRGPKVLPSRADRNVHDDEVLEVGDLRLEVWHTPGHSPGSICIYEREAGVLFSGDTLYRRGVGRTDLPGSSLKALSESLLRLAQLPDETWVYPAHGLPTKIGAERWLLDLANEVGG